MSLCREPALVHKSGCGRAAVAGRRFRQSVATSACRGGSSGPAPSMRPCSRPSGRQGPGAKAAADDGLVAEHRRFRVRPPAVADRPLPPHATLVPDHLDVLVALAGCGARGWARHGGGAWRDDHRHGGSGWRSATAWWMGSPSQAPSAVAEAGRPGICPSKAPTWEASPSSLLVSSEARSSPLLGPSARCNLRHVRVPRPPCFSASHAPAP